jgi:hypothetical protein
MRFAPRALTVVVVAAGCPYDPETPEFDVITDTDGSSSTSGATGNTATDPDTTDGPGTTPETTAPETTLETSNTSPPGDCGDGEIGGDEVCDDGTNDGSYGGCLPGCGAAGPSCGDAEINGPEVCDDGTNDGSYGGCEVDCGSLAAFCGDGTMQGPEMCDNGAANENGSGCNVDCVVSGTVVGTYALGGLDFCDGSFTTPPVFRADGSALVSASGYCGNDSVVLAELSPAVELVQMFDDLLIPQTPLRAATMAGDNWILASYGCTYAISAMGELTEVCEEGRIAGEAGLDARDDGSYIALGYDVLGSYPTGSPMIGDSPDWQINAAGDAFFDFDFWAATIGAADSTYVVGTRRYVPDGTSLGYLARYTAAGNLAGDTTFNNVENLAAVAVGSDGTVAVASGYPVYRVMGLANDSSTAWSLDISTNNNILLGVDSTGAVVMAYIDAVSSSGVLRKWTADGATELWSIEIDSAGYNSRMAIASDDSIWLTTATNAGFGAAKISP